MRLNQTCNNININNDKNFLKNSVTSYSRMIKTKKNEFFLNIETKDNELVITCYYEKNYFKHIFCNSFSLENLKQKSNFYNMFESVNDILKEIKENKSKKREYIYGDEENSNSIKLIIPISLVTVKNISFELNKYIKSEKEKMKEKDDIIKRYEYEDRISGLNESRILINKETEKKAIKFWISPNKRLIAELIYSFHNNYNFKNIKGQIPFTQSDGAEIRKFHRDCDHESNILMICKSKNEIFGGYTPLCFDRSNDYKYDNKSFLFSLNKFEKYPKDSIKITRSICCYDNYGPSFYYDLAFLKNNIDTVIFDKSRYLTVDNWVDKNKCYLNTKGVMLEDLEIFKIKEVDYNYEEIKSESNYKNKLKINNKDNNILNNTINFNIKNNIKDNIINEININENKFDANNSLNLDDIDNISFIKVGEDTIKENSILENLIDIKNEEKKDIIKDDKKNYFSSNLISEEIKENIHDNNQNRLSLNINDTSIKSSDQ